MTSEAALAKLMWVLGQTRDLSTARELFCTPVANDTIE
jgi:L-asparaginase/Glu-tRNA(Gln) amidotransferase subunit D